MQPVAVQREPNFCFAVFLKLASSRSIVQPGRPAKTDTGASEGSVARLNLVDLFCRF